MNYILPIIDDTLGARRPIIIAGPCSAESEQQVLDTAHNLADNGIKIFRAGLWKPRTHPEDSKEWGWSDSPGCSVWPPRRA